MTPTTAPRSPFEQELIDAARALIPMLKAGAAAAEREGRIAAEAVQRMQDAGLFRILQPRRHGGLELNPGVFYEVQMALAEGDMSAAWIFGVIGVHNWQLALFDARAQHEVWGDDPHTRISSAYIPVGRVQHVEGGFRLSGRWSYSSGCEHCRWIFLGAMAPPPPGCAGEAEYRTFLLPQGDYRIERNWEVMGLRGTGSHDIVVNDVFVPGYRTHRTRDDSHAARPGLAVNTSPLYTLPFAQVFVRAVSSSCIGALQGALNDFLQVGSGNVSRNFLGRTAEDPNAQAAVADTLETLDYLKLALFRNVDHMLTCAARGEAAPLEDRLLYRYQSARVADLCAQQVSRLFQSCGAAGVYLDRPLVRRFLDLHTARSHVANHAAPLGRNLGGYRMGLDNRDPTV
jgi:3-hydroxy-9,10-secoandrosta-1,3,5(10)-triene-9,17-dione monooxygenase